MRQSMRAQVAMGLGMFAGLLTWAPGALFAGPVHGTAFTYQGKLTDVGQPANGEYDFVFRLFDDPAAGAEVAPPVVSEDISVSDGLFTTTLDFGTNDFYFGFWLQIEVRPGDSSDPHTPLLGRVYVQQVPAAGKAQVAEQAFDAFTLGGNEASAFAPAGHQHTSLVSPDGSIEVFVVDGSHQARVQIGDAGLTVRSPASGQFDVLALAGTTNLRLMGQDQGIDQPVATWLQALAGSNFTTDPGAGGNLEFAAGQSFNGDGGDANLSGGSSSGGGGRGGFVGVYGGDSADYLGGTVRVEAGDSATSQGGVVTLRGGDSGGSGWGGNVTVFAGDAGSEGLGKGGRFYVLAGDGGSGGLLGQRTLGPGGDVTLIAGVGTPGGELSLMAGQGDAFGGNAAGGELLMRGGPGGGFHHGDGGPGGNVRIAGGDGDGDLDNPGGDVHIAGGASSFGTSTGTVFIDSPAQFASTVHVAAEPGATASLTGGSVGGDFAVAASDSSSGNQLGSALFLRGGSVLAGGTAGGGGIGLFAGDGAPAGFTNELGGPGGNIVVRGGDGRGVGQNAGGDVVLAGGDSSDGSPARDGIVAIQSLVSILRNAQRPENGAVLQVGQPGFENGNGAFLSNDGVWTNASDVNSKAVVGDVDGREVLARVLALPLKNWRHKASPDGPVHMGPMAQDFFAAFGLGNSDRHIGSVDADGVALAAIQGLHAEASQRLVALEEENRQLRERLARLEAILQVKE